MTEEELTRVSGGTGRIMYVVRSGDTLWNLDSKYQTTVQAIVSLNPYVIKDPNKVCQGTILTIRGLTDYLRLLLSNGIIPVFEYTYL